MLIIIFTKLQCTKTTSKDSDFSTFSLFLSESTSFYVLPNNFIVSGVSLPSSFLPQ